MSGCITCPNRSNCEMYRDSSGMITRCSKEGQGRGLKFVGYEDFVESTWFGLSHRHIKLRTYEVFE